MGEKGWSHFFKDHLFSMNYYSLCPVFRINNLSPCFYFHLQSKSFIIGIDKNMKKFVDLTVIGGFYGEKRMVFRI